MRIIPVHRFNCYRARIPCFLYFLHNGRPVHTAVKRELMLIIDAPVIMKMQYCEPLSVILQQVCIRSII